MDEISKTKMEKESLETIAAKAPVTSERKINTDFDCSVPKAYMARALAAVDADHPFGTSSDFHRHDDMSVLQQHVSFFDRNKDGIIYPWETYQGMRAIGFGRLVSAFAGFAINLSLSYPTSPSWIPSPLFPIYVKNIHKGKHGSDSEVFDTEGRFDPAKFDAIFSKYALSHPDKLTGAELDQMLLSNRNVYDFFGWRAAKAEWGFFYTLAKDENGMLSKEALRSMYDGSLFEYIERKRLSLKSH